MGRRDPGPSCPPQAKPGCNSSPVLCMLICENCLICGFFFYSARSSIIRDATCRAEIMAVGMPVPGRVLAPTK